MCNFLKIINQPYSFQFSPLFSCSPPALSDPSAPPEPLHYPYSIFNILLYKGDIKEFMVSIDWLDLFDKVELLKCETSTPLDLKSGT